MSWKHRFAVVTDPGRERPENQDAQGSAHVGSVDFYIVCDGMGGHRAGAMAARIAVETISDFVGEHQELSIEDRVRRALEEANSAIFEAARSDASVHGMGTTAVVLAVDREAGVAICGHVGDSRIYLVRGDAIRQLTRDHTFVQRLVDDGILDAAAAANHPQGNVIIRSLGGMDTVDAELSDQPIALEEGDTFVLCSDGLHGQLAAKEIAELTAGQDIDAAARQLVDAANGRGGPDNITVQLVRVGDRSEPAPEEWTIETPAPAPGTRLAARAAAEAAENEGGQAAGGPVAGAQAGGGGAAADAAATPWDEALDDNALTVPSRRVDAPLQESNTAGRIILVAALIVIVVIAISLAVLVRANAPEPVLGSPRSGASPLMPP